MATNCTVELIGNLGEDPETKHANTDKEFVLLRLATTDSYLTEDGEWKDKDTLWHTVMCFGPTVRGLARSYKKGDRVKITGGLSYRETKITVDGQNKVFNEAIVIGWKIEDARLPKKADAEQSALQKAG
jgi:single-strand DNA-binding protein